METTEKCSRSDNEQGLPIVVGQVYYADIVEEGYIGISPIVKVTSIIREDCPELEWIEAEVRCAYNTFLPTYILGFKRKNLSDPVNYLTERGTNI